VLNTILGSTTTYFVSGHYEVNNGLVTKYYYAGSQRIAMRTNGTLNYLLGDHLGSTSLTTDANGNVVSEMRYKAWGETRYASGSMPTRYQYTGQYSYQSDFGLHFYNARWYDSSLSRFAQADSIVPGGVQGLDRYAYANNNPLRYIDPSGHSYCSSKYALKEDCEDASGETRSGNSISGNRNRRNNNSSPVGCNSQCTAGDIASWSMDVRINWFRWLLSSYNIDQSWFNNIFGILDVFNKYSLGETSTGAGANDWVSWTDAGILVSIQHGLTGGGNYEAAIRWKAFFAAVNDPTNEDTTRIYLWGRAEAAGTAYGLLLAEERHHRPDTQNQAFLFVGDTYRSVMGVPYGGQIVGGVSGAVATGYEGFRTCGPLCAVGGVLLGGTSGAYIGGNIVDPRTMWGNHPPVYYVANAILGFGR
jgi:RHS repeat-associated protein